MSLRDALYDPGRMPIVGGRLCLDLANTANNGPHGVENCRLTTYEALLAWGQHVGLLDEDSRRTLSRRASRRPAAAVEALARVLRLREAIWALFPVRGAQIALPASIEENLDLERTYTLRSAPGGLVIDAGGDLATWLTQPAAFSVVELLSAGPTERVKQCASHDCGWVFVDESPTGRRRWCSMAICGNRAKSRRFQAAERRSS